MIRAKDLSFGYTLDRCLIKGLSFDTGPGEVLMLRGPNGIGKSSLLQVIRGTLLPQKGVFHRGVKASDISYLPQLHNKEFHLPLRLRDVLHMGHRPSDKAQGLNLGLLVERQLDLAWNSASGGERQKTLLTRILSEQSPLMLLDEPFNHLDQEAANQLWRMLQDYVSDGSKTVVLVSHEKAVLPDFVTAKVNILNLGMFT